MSSSKFFYIRTFFTQLLILPPKSNTVPNINGMYTKGFYEAGLDRVVVFLWFLKKMLISD